MGRGIRQTTAFGLLIREYTKGVVVIFGHMLRRLLPPERLSSVTVSSIALILGVALFLPSVLTKLMNYEQRNKYKQIDGVNEVSLF